MKEEKSAWYSSIEFGGVWGLGVFLLSVFQVLGLENLLHATHVSYPMRRSLPTPTGYPQKEKTQV